MKTDYKETLEQVVREVSRTDVPTNKIEWAEVWEIEFTAPQNGWHQAHGYGFAGYGKTAEAALEHWIRNVAHFVNLWNGYKNRSTYDEEEVLRVVSASHDGTRPLGHALFDASVEMELIKLERQRGWSNAEL
ncbi:hypothetical protein [Roseinatronobacter sp.]|uniref:hypothetical protein n=1 Tax=Roseinatronobacter sp. TaxID=1945755 RepID=UPI0025F438A1|nr:hypothetical protein [Roseibaca sp.]